MLEKYEINELKLNEEISGEKNNENNVKSKNKKIKIQS